MSELRAAAERLRQAYARNKIGFLHQLSEVYPENYNATLSNDLRTCALAYLAEHPADDGELIDTAWLKKLGSNKKTHDGIAYLQLDNGDCQANVYATGEVIVEASEKIHETATRGQFRRLCRALGIELQEP